MRIDTTRAGEKADTFREDAYAEIGNYSITPRTFESRTYDGCGYRTVLTYRDEFIFDGNRVTRFGINSENPNLISFVKQDEIGLCSVDDKATTATKRSAKYTPKDVESVKLSTIEIKLLDDSVGSLVSGVSKVVVIDTLDKQNLYVDRLDEIRSGCASSVTVSALPKKIIKDFIGQNNRCVELFCQIPATYQGQLLGSIEKFGEPEEAADCCWG